MEADAHLNLFPFIFQHFVMLILVEFPGVYSDRDHWSFQG